MMILTFPNSGGKLLKDMLLQQLDYDAKLSYMQEQSEDKILTIARDPKEAIHSYMAMKEESGIELSVQDVIDYYVSLYAYLYTSAELVLSYDTVLNSPELALKRISTKFDLKHNGKAYVDNSSGDADTKYLPSSNTSELSNKDYLDGYDLTDAYKSYNTMLTRADL